MKISLRTIRMAKVVFQKDVTNMIKAFHGTNTKFDRFEISKARVLNDYFGGGVGYFTDKYDVAITYAAHMVRLKKAGSKFIYNVDLTMENIFDVDHIFSGPELEKFWETVGLEKFLRGSGQLRGMDDKYTIMARAQTGALKMTGAEVFKGLSNGMVNTYATREILKKLGYDGLRYNGGANMNAGAHNVYLAYDPKDIVITKIDDLGSSIKKESLDETFAATFLLTEGRDAPLFHSMDERKAMDVFKKDKMEARWDHTIPWTKPGGMDNYDDPKTTNKSVWKHREDMTVKGNSFTRNRWAWFSGSYNTMLEVDQAKLNQTNRIITIDGDLVANKSNPRKEIRFNEYWPVIKSRHNEIKALHKKIEKPYKEKREIFFGGYQMGDLAEEFVVGDIKNISRIIKVIWLNEKTRMGFDAKKSGAAAYLDKFYEGYLVALAEYAKKYNIPVKMHPSGIDALGPIEEILKGKKEPPEETTLTKWQKEAARKRQQERGEKILAKWDSVDEDAKQTAYGWLTPEGKFKTNRGNIVRRKSSPFDGPELHVHSARRLGAKNDAELENKGWVKVWLDKNQQRGSIINPVANFTPEQKAKIKKLKSVFGNSQNFEIFDMSDIPNENEAVEAEPNGFNISRELLPQITGDIQVALHSYLKLHNIGFEITQMKSGDLRPIQNEYDYDKIQSLRKAKSWEKAPLIVSREGAILDGHHRWRAAVQQGADTECKVIKIDLPILELWTLVKTLSEPTLAEGTSHKKGLVLAFGRFNPITKGHEKLINQVVSTAKKLGYDHIIYPSMSVDPDRNPLRLADKLSFLKSFFPRVNFGVGEPTVIKAITRAEKDGYSELMVFGGDDRVAEYEKILKTYNKQKTDKDYKEGRDFSFQKVGVINAGERDDSADDVTGISASKMRAYARADDFQSFVKGAPSRPMPTVRKMFMAVKKGMALGESLEEGVNDPGIFKAVFLGGGPGAGKDFIKKNVLLGHGFVEINSDIAFEHLMKKHGLSMQMTDDETVARDIVRDHAKTITHKKFEIALKNRLGLIINSTAADPQKISKMKDALEKLGYTTKMIFVSTDDNISKLRNIERGEQGGRTVKEPIRAQKWQESQVAKGELAKIFGNDYQEISNNRNLAKKDNPQKLLDAQKTFTKHFKIIRKFAEHDHAHPAKEKWINSIKKGTQMEGVDSYFEKVFENRNNDNDEGDEFDAHL